MRGTRIRSVLTLGACVVFAPLAHAYSTEPGVTATRQFSAETAGPGDVVGVTLTVEVGAIGGDPVRGFFLSDHVPEGLSPAPGTVTVNGASATVTRESLPAGSVHAAATTERWVFETPPAWPEDVPVAAASTIAITYDVTIPVGAQTGEVVFPGFDWVGMIDALGDAGDHFGYETGPAVISVVDDRPPEIGLVSAAGVATVVTVRFTEPVDEASATSHINYSIDNGVTVESASMEDAGTVGLVTSALSEAVTYTLTVDNVADAAGNAIAPGSQAAFSFTSALVVHWALDDGAGGIASDSSGNGNEGTVSGATWTAGKTGGALSFDGTDDYVSCAITSWNAAAYTVCVWAKAAAVGQAEWTSVANNASTPENSSFQMDVDGGDPGSYRMYFKDVKVPIGQVTTEWRHLAVTYDGVTVSTYLNGELAQSGPVAPELAGTLFRQYVIGRNRAGNAYFNGLIDDFRIYDRALGGAALAAIAAEGE